MNSLAGSQPGYPRPVKHLESIIWGDSPYLTPYRHASSYIATMFSTGVTAWRL